MLFSIIIPAYNAAGTIGYCLDSVISQDFPREDYEIIVVDDCSPDKQNDVIQAYCANYPPRFIKFIKHKENKRQGGARNTALKAAEGEWIMFLDADDYWCSPDVLKTFTSEIAGHPQAEIIESVSHTDVDSYHGDMEISSSYIDTYKTGIEILLSGIYSSYIVRSAYRKSFIENIPFREKVFFEDGDWRVKIALSAQQTVVIDYPFYCYVNNPNSTCRGKNIETFYANIDCNALMLDLYSSQSDKRVCDYGMRRIKSNILSWLKISRDFKISQSTAVIRHATRTELFNPKHYTFSIFEKTLFNAMKYLPFLTVASIKGAVLIRRKLRKLLSR